MHGTNVKKRKILLLYLIRYGSCILYPVPALYVGGDLLLSVYINQQVNEMHCINNVQNILNVFSLSFQVSVCLCKGQRGALRRKREFCRHFHIELSDIIWLFKTCDAL